MGQYDDYHILCYDLHFSSVAVYQLGGTNCTIAYYRILFSENIRRWNRFLRQWKFPRYRAIGFEELRVLSSVEMTVPRYPV